MCLKSVVQLRATVEKVLQYWEEMSTHPDQPSFRGVRDEENDRYAILMTQASDGLATVQMLALFEIYNNQIYITFDNLEKGVANELLNLGIPEEQIVVAFHCHHKL